MSEQPSQESMIGGIKKGMDALLGGHLKHSREAGHISKESEKVKDTSTDKFIVDETICQVLRPDLNADLISYSDKVLDFLNYFHNKDLYRATILWSKDVSKVLNTLDFSDRERFRNTLTAASKQLPDGYLDKMPRTLRTMQGAGSYERLYNDKDRVWEEQDKVKLLPGFDRFISPGVTMKWTRSNGEKIKPYRGNNQLPVMSIKDIRKVMEAYAKAEELFQIGKQLGRFGWPDIGYGNISGRFFKMADISSGGEFKLWSRYVKKDMDILNLYASMKVIVRWIHGNRDFVIDPTQKTDQFRIYFEFMYKWAKRSFELHSRNASMESRYSDDNSQMVRSELVTLKW